MAEMENFQTPRKSARGGARAIKSSAGIAAGALKIERSTTGKLPISIDFPAAVREACVGRRSSSASDADRDPDPRAERSTPR